MSHRMNAIAYATALVLAATASLASASTIVWSSAIPISGNADISTSGTYVDAIMLGTGSDVSDTSGDTFHHVVGTPTGGTPNTLASQTGNSTDPITVTLDNLNYSAGSPQTSNANYNSILGTLGFDGNRGNAESSTVTLNGLTTGHSYQVEFWASQTTATNSNTAAISGGPLLDASDPSANPSGISGNYALGGFTADATQTQAFTFTSNGNPVVNAIMLRDTTTPEPAVLGLLGLGVPGLLLRRRPCGLR